MRPIAFTLCLLVVGLVSSWAQHPELEAAIDLANKHAYAASNEALELFITNHPQRKYDVAQAWWLISGNELALGRPAKALADNETSLAIRQRLRSGDMALNYLRASEIHLATQKSSDALYAAQEGMQMFIEDSRLFAELNLAAARALEQLNRSADADGFVKTALDIAAIEFGTNSPAFGDISFAAAQIQQDQKKYYTAFQSYAKAFYRVENRILRVRALVGAYGLFRWQ